MIDKTNTEFRKKPNTCTFCKGKLKKGETDFTVKTGHSVISIKNVPAYVCENCGEAYYDPDTSRKIDSVLQDFHKGDLLAHPLAAGEIEFDRVA
jgi:YgiT-type zinc finger domain-containing protein